MANVIGNEETGQTVAIIEIQTKDKYLNAKRRLATKINSTKGQRQQFLLAEEFK